MKRGIWIGILLLAVVVGACAPGSGRQSIEAIPTLFPTNTPPGQDIASAERPARLFLDAWERGDYEAMYSLTAFNSQEAIALQNFIDFYETAHDEMSLLSLSYKANALGRGGSSRVAVFNYDMTFETEVLGAFTDANRDLLLVIDDRSGQWRVAWTPGDIFAEMADGGTLRLERFSLRRANIYDRDGDILADQLGKVAIVHVIPQQIPVYNECINLLAEATGLSTDAVQTKLNDAKADWLTEIGAIEPPAYLAHHEALESTCKAQFTEQFTRRYRTGTLAPHVVGYVGYPSEDELPELRAAGFDQDSILGRTGIEKTWDEPLRGDPGGRLVIVSQGGDVLREIARKESQQSQSVWLTIDSDLQQYVIQVIGETYLAAADDWAKASDGAAVVVIDVNTGEILALVSWPLFDANAFTPYPAIGKDVAEAMKTEVTEDPRRPLLNRATVGQYPAGSVMKTVSAIAVAESGLYTADTKFNCTYTWQREPNFTRYNWTDSQGVLNLTQAITQSCNPYFYEIGYQMDQVDPNLLPEYARALGLGEATGIGDLIESPGTIPDPQYVADIGATWTMSDSINMAVGQGYVQVTPLQIARLFALYANGGALLRPQLVQQVGLIGDSPSYTLEPEVLSHVAISQEVWDILREGMCNVTVAPAGTATHIFRGSDLLDLGVCGKTGTAQSTDDAAPHAWFAAYAPRENPQIAVAVIVEHAGDGSAVAAPITRRIMEYYFFGTKTSLVAADSGS